MLRRLAGAGNFQVYFTFCLASDSLLTIYPSPIALMQHFWISVAGLP